MLFPFPFGGGNAQASSRSSASPEDRPNSAVSAELNSISPGYFAGVGHPAAARPRLRRDRRPERRRRSRSSANRPARSSAARIRSAKRSTWAMPVTVVGIVSDARRRSLDARAEGRRSTCPTRSSCCRTWARWSATDRGAGAVASAVKAAVAQIDPDLPIGDVKTMEQIIERVDRRAALPIVPDRELRGAGAAAGRRRRLRPDQLHRHAAGARDWRAAGARRQPAPGVRAGHRPGLRLPASASCSGWRGALPRTTLIEGLLFDTSATDPVVYAVARRVAAGDRGAGMLCSG